MHVCNTHQSLSHSGSLLSVNASPHSTLTSMTSHSVLCPIEFNKRQAGRMAIQGEAHRINIRDEQGMAMCSLISQDLLVPDGLSSEYTSKDCQPFSFLNLSISN